MMSDHHYHDDSDNDEWAWGVEWIWVGGYSAAATTIILLHPKVAGVQNILLLTMTIHLSSPEGGAEVLRE